MKTRAILTITLFGMTLAATQDAYGWGEARMAAGKARVSRGKAQVNKAARQRQKIAPSARKGLGCAAQVPGAALAAGKTTALRQRSAKGFRDLRANVGGSVANGVSGRYHLAVGRTQQAIGSVQKGISDVGSAIGKRASQAGNRVWNSRAVSFGRLATSAAGLGAGKLWRGIRGMGKALSPGGMTDFVKKNGGTVPTRYKAPRAAAAPVPAGQLMNMADQLK